MRNPTVRSSLATLCAIALTAIAAESRAYTVTGDLFLQIVSPVITVDRSQDTGTTQQDGAFLLGDNRNLGYGMYIVSLDQGMLFQHLQMDNGELPPFGVYHQTAQGTTDIDIIERLDFTVPAGTYPDGITGYLGVTVQGRVEALNGSDRPYATALVHIDLWGSDTYTQNYGPINPGDPPVVVDESFEMEIPIAAPGASGGSPWVVSQILASTLEGSAGTGSFATENGSSVSWFRITFDYIDISEPGVTWTSESGVFSVPEPSASTLLLAGLPALGLLGVRRRRLAREAAARLQAQ